MEMKLPFLEHSGLNPEVSHPFCGFSTIVLHRPRPYLKFYLNSAFTYRYRKHKILALTYRLRYTSLYTALTDFCLGCMKIVRAV